MFAIQGTYRRGVAGSDPVFSLKNKGLLLSD
jgi:hypothetical protein